MATAPRFTTTAGKRMTGGPDWQPGAGTRAYYQALDQLIDQAEAEAVPNGYAEAVAARRAAEGLGSVDAVVVTNGVPNGYATALARLRR